VEYIGDSALDSSVGLSDGCLFWRCWSRSILLSNGQAVMGFHAAEGSK
jgi:hypothetical protein